MSSTWGNETSGTPAETVATPLAEEVVHVDTRDRVTGTVRVHVAPEIIEETVRADLKEHNVEVNRLTIDQVVTEMPRVRTEGEVTIIPVVEEVLVVTKQLVLKEEIHVRRALTSKTVEVPVTVRKERALVERLPPNNPDQERER